MRAGGRASRWVGSAKRIGRQKGQGRGGFIPLGGMDSSNLTRRGPDVDALAALDRRGLFRIQWAVRL